LTSPLQSEPSVFTDVYVAVATPLPLVVTLTPPAEASDPLIRPHDTENATFTGVPVRGASFTKAVTERPVFPPEGRFGVMTAIGDKVRPAAATAKSTLPVPATVEPDIVTSAFAVSVPAPEAVNDTTLTGTTATPDESVSAVVSGNEAIAVLSMLNVTTRFVMAAPDVSFTVALARYPPPPVILVTAWPEALTNTTLIARAEAPPVPPPPEPVVPGLPPPPPQATNTVTNNTVNILKSFRIFLPIINLFIALDHGQ
jgi:hypothetical protein